MYVQSINEDRVSPPYEIGGISSKTIAPRRNKGFLEIVCYENTQKGEGGLELDFGLFMLLDR